MSNFTTPLAGVRVADFCWVGAGSYTTKILADLGADVIKIESMQHLDSLRTARPFPNGETGVNRSGYFADRNTSKRSITINLKADDGPEIARQLILQSDVVTNNFSPGTLTKFGLGYDDIEKQKSEIIFAEMSMQGAIGPARDYMGYGAMVGAMCGLLHLTSAPGLPPMGTGTNYPDHIPNPCHAAFAILAAIRHQRRTGEGQYIDLAQTEPTMAMIGPAFGAASMGMEPAPHGNQHLDVAPHGVYPCAGEDRWIAIVARDNAQWEAVIYVVGAQALGDDVRFATEGARISNSRALDEALSEFTQLHLAEDLMAELQERGVAAGVVHDAKGVIDHDPQLASRGHWQRLVHPEMGETIYNAPPFRFQNHPVGLRHRAPLLGEHTEQICAEVLQMDSGEIERLRKAKALY